MSKPENPSAFPIPNDDRPGAYEAAPGMSLRDWFAGQAVVGIMSTAGAFQRCDRRPEMVARNAYEFADALLAERKKDEQ